MMNKIEVYTRPGCAYCVSAKRLLNAEGLEFVEHDTSANSEKLTEMLHRSPQRTFPQIFIDDQLVGGFDDLVKLKQATKLN
jgi:glutaredoxin 3